MFRVQIADILLDFLDENLSIPDSFMDFSVNEKNAADIKVYIKRSSFINKPENKRLLHNEINWCEDNSALSAHIYDKYTDKILMRLNMHKSLNTSSITYLDEYCNSVYSISGPLGEILFRTKILFHKGLVIHAAAIEHQGKGIIFSAPSETGKSTQASLWKQYMGASIINGDRPAIRLIDNNPYVYGTPWSGSSSDFKNCRAPLSAIVMLEQAPENSLIKLDKSKALNYLLPRCFLPYQNSNLMTLALDNLTMIIETTPIYLLKCKPDKEAVELVYQCAK